MAIYPSIMYKKKQIASDELCRAHLQCVSVETTINITFCNINDVVCDKWNKELDNLHNLNTKHKKHIYKPTSCTHAWKI